MLTFNVSGFGERQGATVQNQHGAILPHVPVLAGSGEGEDANKHGGEASDPPP